MNKKLCGKELKFVQLFSNHTLYEIDFRLFSTDFDKRKWNYFSRTIKLHFMESINKLRKLFISFYNC